MLVFRHQHMILSTKHQYAM